MKLKGIITIARPQFLILAVILGFLGTAIAWYEHQEYGGAFNLGYAFLGGIGLIIAPARPPARRSAPPAPASCPTRVPPPCTHPGPCAAPQPVARPTKPSTAIVSNSGARRRSAAAPAHAPARPLPIPSWPSDVLTYELFGVVRPRHRIFGSPPFKLPIVVLTPVCGLTPEPLLT